MFLAVGYGFRQFHAGTQQPYVVDLRRLLETLSLATQRGPTVSALQTSGDDLPSHGIYKGSSCFQQHQTNDPL